MFYKLDYYIVQVHVFYAFLNNVQDWLNEIVGFIYIVLI